MIFVILKVKKEKQMELHMSEEHYDCYCCYLCAKYFETKQSIKYHNKFIHTKHHQLTESKDEDSSKKNNAKENQKGKKHAKKKKGTKNKTIKQKLVPNVMNCISPLQ